MFRMYNSYNFNITISGTKAVNLNIYHVVSVRFSVSCIILMYIIS